MEVFVIGHEVMQAQKLKELLFEVDESIRIVGISETIGAAMDWLHRNRIPDIILATEEIMAGLDERKMKDIRAVVTFTTSSENLKFHAFRYKTIREIIAELPVTEERPVSLAPVVSNHSPFPAKQPYKERFLVKQGQRLLSISVSQVAYFFSEERFIFLRTFDNQKFLLEYRMEQLEKLLSPQAFFRINRSYIVSLDTVKEIHAYFGNRLKLFLSPSAESEVIVSRKRVNEFKQWLDR